MSTARDDIRTSHGTPELKAPLTPPQEPQDRAIIENDISHAWHDTSPLDKTEDPISNGQHVNGKHLGLRKKSSLLSSPGILQEEIPINGPRLSRTSSEASFARPKAVSYGSSNKGLSPVVLHDGENGTIFHRVSIESSRDRTTKIDLLPPYRISPVISEDPSEVENKPGFPDRTLSPPLEDNSLESWPRPSGHEKPTQTQRPRNLTINVGADKLVLEAASTTGRPKIPRASSTPAGLKSPSGGASLEQRRSRNSYRVEQPVKGGEVAARRPSSPVPVQIPLPPMSLSAYLQLELSSHRPSPLYIYRPASSDFPYESSRVKIDRLLNFLFLPPHLEAVLWFGVLGCVDSWLYVFTILPLRMVKSIYILVLTWAHNLTQEMRFLSTFVVSGLQRMWHRERLRRESASNTPRRPSFDSQPSAAENLPRQRPKNVRHHRRTKSTPSNLLPDDKADILKGLLIICTCLVLLRLDASRMYHWVRGQAAIKLYVIYNLLEVGDRQLSAIGQDVLECLFSQEALERKPDGHSKVLRPFWLFLLAWVYCIIHSTALFYQVITMNVAVNSYSSALITLLMSNQFTEIKSTIFKKFEKENLFQLTCADVVERFQLWHMLIIIASRNIVETGGLNFGLPKLMAAAPSTTSAPAANVTFAAPPRSASSVLPKSFMILPNMLTSLTSYAPTVAHVMGPFVIVLGSEMLIDWLKHAYISKFNNTKPVIYDRFLDVLAKDYYTNAFGNQNLVKRLGLPVIPLSCLMIRAGFQTYQMLVASWVPGPSVSVTTASLADIHQQYSATRAEPTSTAGIIVRKMDELLNHLPSTISSARVTAYFTTTLVILLMFFVLLIMKLILGMALLTFARARYQSYRRKEQNPAWYVEGGKRVGGWGTIEVDEDKKRWIYADDPEGLKNMRQREVKDKARKEKEKEEGYGISGLEKVVRYEMAAKRIW